MLTTDRDPPRLVTRLGASFVATRPRLTRSRARHASAKVQQLVRDNYPKIRWNSRPRLLNTKLNSMRVSIPMLVGNLQLANILTLINFVKGPRGLNGHRHHLRCVQNRCLSSREPPWEIGLAETDHPIPTLRSLRLLPTSPTNIQPIIISHIRPLFPTTMATSTTLLPSLILPPMVHHTRTGSLKHLCMREVLLSLHLLRQTPTVQLLLAARNLPKNNTILIGVYPQTFTFMIGLSIELAHSTLVLTEWETARTETTWCSLIFTRQDLLSIYTSHNPSLNLSHFVPGQRLR